MTRKEIIEGLKLLEDNMVHFDELQNDKGEWIDVHELLFETISALEQEPSRDMEEIAEIMKCDADAETKCKMISNVITAKPHYFKEQEPCEKNTLEGLFKNIKKWEKEVDQEPCDNAIIQNLKKRNKDLEYELKVNLKKWKNAYEEGKKDSVCDVISVINILADKMDESGKTAAEQFISAIKDMGVI